MTHLINPNNLRPLWRHHPTKPVFVSNTGLITSEPKYRDAVNHHNTEQYTIDQLLTLQQLPQPQPDHQPKSLKPYLNTARRNFWYITIPFHKKICAVHTLVAETFLIQPTADHKYIRFLDNNKNNCTAPNLEYATRKELVRKQTSTTPHPKAHPVDVLRPDLSLFGSYPTLSDAARALNVTLSRVSEAYNGVRPSVHGYTILARPEDAPIPPPYVQQQHEPEPQRPQTIPDYSGLEGEY